MADVSSYYAFNPSHALPIAFTALIGVSLALHIWQNFRYRYWRVTFFMCWGGLVFTSGWIMRAVSSYEVGNLHFYAAQYVLVLCGPPIYSAAEYNVLGRLLLYLPMHSPIHPRRIMYFFIYLGAAVESLTAAGGARMAVAKNDKAQVQSGAALVAAASVLQVAVECCFISMVAMLHRRIVRARMLTPDIRKICTMLYGTSTFILIRSAYRAVEKFSILETLGSGVCEGTCNTVLRHEWYLYAFEAAPMVLYTWWINLVHPGRYLPSNPNIYLGYDKVERCGPGWVDRRSAWQTFADPFDWVGLLTGKTNHEKFWEHQDDYPIYVKTSKANGRELARTEEIYRQVFKVQATTS
ncbi:uncharacterized protein PV09_03532 [Verruconis gallopava]|uniref:RTA1 domain protein n=1 Tax=Verruconis gallopava TaxID=253628 RepID=A0A0D2AFC4_9PEZI|nr:uncharacterized protein PV09_03532 [Verruconis gallopava]KIW05668.1 hypothetical protein PV09_03532 [Verruconis gallopava]